MFEKGDIIGFDGIINLEKLENKGAEGKIKHLAYKFIKINSIVTNNAELNKALNALIKGMPEFVNIIGKQQHDTHDLSLDIHILTVLENALKDEEYKNLSELDKTCLKFAIIMHDIAKSEGVIDDAHPEMSALFARNILEKYQLPIEIKDRIFELIKYHHWLQDYSTQKTEANQMAALFRHKDDFSIAKIIAKADLKGVSDDFYNSHLEALNNDKLKPIEEALEKIYSTGQFIFTSKVIKKELIPQVEYEGYTYKVIDFTKINKDTDLAKYGFTPGTTSESLRLLVHMANTPRALEIVDCISDIAKESFLCTSYISLENCITYYGCTFGLNLEAENINIANAACEDQGSGCRKNFEQFKEMITINDYRKLIPTTIRRILNLNKSEYSKLYQLLASKKYLSQIRDDKIYKIGEKELSGNEIKKAIQTAQDELLIEQIEGRNNNNEINLYNIKINALVARVKSIEEIPQEFLDFAFIHDLPIYILGYR